MHGLAFDIAHFLAGGMVVFYYSPLFEFALRNHAGHLWMIVHFTLAGYLFANALVGIDPGHACSNSARAVASAAA